MKIHYIKTQYGFNVETDIEYCCDEMKSFYDLTHTNPFCITLGFTSGKVRLISENSDYIWLHQDISYCPFCGEKIEIDTN